MAGKYLQIVLFVVLQIALVLCRTTGKPEELEKEILTTDEVLRPEALKQTVETGTMLYDVRVNNGRIDVTYDSGMETAVIIYAIIVPVFIILSLILGCIMMCCCKKEPRRGFVVSSAGVQATGPIQGMQQYPPPYGQKY